MGFLDTVLTFPARAHSDAPSTIRDMKLTTSLLATAAAVLGLGGAATAYQMASAPASTVRPVSQTSSDDDSVEVVVPTIEQGTQFQWAPCKPPAVQKGDDCVVEQVQTVVVGGGESSSDDSDSSGGGGYTEDDSDDQPTYDDSDDDSDDSDDHADEDDSDDDHEDEPDEPEEPEDND